MAAPAAIDSEVDMGTLVTVFIPNAQGDRAGACCASRTLRREDPALLAMPTLASGISPYATAFPWHAG